MAQSTRLSSSFMKKGLENFHEILDKADFSTPFGANEVAETLSDTLSLREVAKVIGCSKDKANRILDELLSLGIVQHEPLDGGYKWVV